jgi:adhesin transport system membrane fusion protein
MRRTPLDTREEARRGRVLIWTCTAALAGLIGWASWAELDQVTRASGQVIASSRNQIIQVADGGVLSELRVHEGSIVKKGALLARFDRTRAETSYLESSAKAAGLKATVARLQAEVFGGTPKFPAELKAYPEFTANQRALFSKRQGAVQAEVSALESASRLIQEELEMNLPLLETGDVSRAETARPIWSRPRKTWPACCKR